VVALAWEIGILAGLNAAGVKPWQGGDVIGSSAGAFAGAAILDPRGIDWAYERQLSGDIQEVSASLSPELIERLVAIIRDFSAAPAEAGKRLGALALNATTIDANTRLNVVRDRLRTSEWPSDRLAFTAIDAVSGQLELLDRACDVDIVTAAAASCAIPGVWPAVAAGGGDG
jgi:NTE family protein